MCAVDVAGSYKISGGGFTLVRFTSIHAGKTDTGGVTPRRPHKRRLLGISAMAPMIPEIPDDRTQGAQFPKP